MVGDGEELVADGSGLEMVPKTNSALDLQTSFFSFGLGGGGGVKGGGREGDTAGRQDLLRKQSRRQEEVHRPCVFRCVQGAGGHTRDTHTHPCVAQAAGWRGMPPPPPR